MHIINMYKEECFSYYNLTTNLFKEGNGEMSSAYSSYLSSDKQVQEELILTLSHKHHSDDNDTPEDRPSAAEIAEILIQLSKEDESTSNCVLNFLFVILAFS